MGFLSRTGIGVNLVPGDVSYGVDVQRTSDNGSGVAASTGATTIVEMPEGSLPEVGSIYFDLLPMDGAKRFYRARHTGKGYDEGGWTDWTTGHTPVLLPDQTLAAAKAPSAYPVKRDRKMGDGYYPAKSANAVGTEFSTDMYLPSTYVLRVGTTGTPTSLTKQIRIGPHTFVPRSPATTAYLYDSVKLEVPWSAAWPLNEHFFTDVVFPPGVTLTSITSRLFGATSAGASTGNFLQLNRLDDETTATTLATLYMAQGAAGWSTVSSSLSQVVSSSQAFSLALVVTMSSGGSPAIAMTAVEYTMPSYDKGY